MIIFKEPNKNLGWNSYKRSTVCDGNKLFNNKSWIYIYQKLLNYYSELEQEKYWYLHLYIHIDVCTYEPAYMFTCMHFYTYMHIYIYNTCVYIIIVFLSPEWLNSYFKYLYMGMYVFHVEILQIWNFLEYMFQYGSLQE